ncbi:MAG: solute carrier family 23 protein [bacterium]
MAKRPSGLIYGVQDMPPVAVLAALAVQHIFLMSSTLVLPVVLVKEIGGSFDQIRSVVGLSMIASGLGTILQAMRWRGVGSGYLCPNLCGPNFFTACVEAAWLGGLPLMRGMVIVAGLTEAVFARAVHRLKFLFPTEITGLVVLMVAVGLVPLGVSKFLGINYDGEPIQKENLAVAALTLLIMVGVNVWGKGKLRLYSVLMGMIFGYLLSLTLGLLGRAQLHDIVLAPWVALPFLEDTFKIAFRWSLLPTFIIVSICGALKTFGNLILCEKINDEEWSQPDINQIGTGLMADSICVTASGLLGGMASDTSASNVSLSSASGATSRYIGYAAGALFMLLGFSPKLSAVLSVMPMPVMGAILVFVTSYMIISGLSIIIGSGMDSRNIYVIGISMVFGLSLDILPQLYAGVPAWLRPLFDSSLTFSTVLAVVLNQLLSLGKRKDAKASDRPAGTD